MKKRFAILTTALAAALGLLLLSACANPFAASSGRRDAADEGKGLVRIGAGAGAARTALPAAVFDHIEYLFSHNGGADQTIAPTGDGGDEFELESGDWTVTVNAYAETGEDSLAASGSESFHISLGEETEVIVKLSPVASEGEGKLSYALSFPDGATILSFTLTRLAVDASIDLTQGAVAEGESLTGEKTVDAGYYLARAALQKDGVAVSRREVVHIYQNMATGLAFAFTDNDFKATLVFSSADSGPGSLREAIAATAAEGTIALMLPENDRVITLSSTLVIDKNLTIMGNGAIITQSGLNGSLVSIANKTVTISRVHFRGGMTTGNGGAISISGGSAPGISLLLESCIFSDNQATGDGGAVYVGGSGRYPVRARGSTFYGNRAGGEGGAIYGPSIAPTGCLFYGNTAAGAVSAVYQNTAESATYTYSVSDMNYWHPLPSIGTAIGNRLISSLPLSPLTFRPLGGLGASGAEGIATRPAEYPLVDFQGTAIPETNIAAGAIQTPTAAGRYFLDYAATGPGVVLLSAGNPDEDGLFTGSATLRAEADPGKDFLYWIVNGARMPAQNPPAELTLAMDENQTVRAFIAAWTVTSDADSGTGTLREALTNLAEGDIILLSPGATIILATPLPQITKSIIIEGNGATLTQSGFTPGSGTQLLSIRSTTAEVRIRRLHFKGGRTTGSGGAILSDGVRLALESCIFSDNQANYGGAVYVTGSTASLAVLGCTFYGNTAATSGGAIFRNGPTVTLTGNIFWGNTAASYPVANYSSQRPNALSSEGFNISDKQSGQLGSQISGWNFRNGDKQLGSPPVSPVNFKPFAGAGAEGIITTRPADYPTVDFYGDPIPESGAAAGATQTPAGGYYLDYAAQGLGTVDLTAGSQDPDGLYSGSVTFRAEANPGSEFLHWTVNGAKLPVQTIPTELTLVMDGHKTVRGVFGGTWAVTSNADSGTGTLREALTGAVEGDYIVLQGQTITLATPLPQITVSLTIEGNGATLTQSGFSESALSQLLYISSATADVYVSRLHFKGGRAVNNGAAIYNNGAKLTLESCIFSDNRTSNANAYGGAVYTSGGTASATVSGCTFYGNVAGTSGGRGGAMYRNGGTLVLTGNVFWGNTAATSPVVYYSGGAATGGYNVSDKGNGYADNTASSGWTFAGSDMQFVSLPIFPASFKLFAGIGADGIISPRPSGYPIVDFYGDDIPDINAAAGAVQSAVTGYMLDYAAQGPGVVQLGAGANPNIDGLYSGSIIFTATPDGGKEFLHWIVNGIEDAETSTTLNLTMDGHKTVRGVFGGTWTVNNADSGTGSLREALTGAGDGDVILLPEGETIALASALPPITVSLAIEGNGATLTRSGFAESDASQLLRISSDAAEVYISRLHFKGGRAANNGAAIYNAGKLALESCVFSDNRTSNAGAYGGAVYTTGGTASVAISGCTFYGNAAGTGGKGGAIYRNDGILTLRGNVFWGNTAATSPVVYHSSGATTRGYNVSDKASGYTDNAESTGWTFDGSDANPDSLPVFPVNFKPFIGGGADSIIDARPQDYPIVDFYGVDIPDINAAAGAVQSAVTGYMLDYAAEGFGAVEPGVGTNPNIDGLYSDSVTLKAVPGGVNASLVRWLVNGEVDDETGDELTLIMDGHKIVRAVFATTWTVNNADSGDGSLRDALAGAADGDTIILPSGATIILSTALTMDKSLVIKGNGATLTQSSFAESGASQLLRITSGAAEVSISRLHFKGGRATNNGAAIYNIGDLVLESCVFSDNRTSDTSAQGGAVYTLGNISVSGCTFYGNVAGTTGSLGGAVYKSSGTVTLRGNLFWGNTANTYGVVYGTAVSQGYNIADRPIGTGATESGWTSFTGDARALTLPLDPADFKPLTTGAAYRAIATTPGDYPALDFYGVSIPSSNAMAGAAQTAIAAGYELDSAAVGPGQVAVTGSSDSYGFYTGNVTLEAAPTGNGTFMHWTVDGATQEPQSPPNKITINMDSHKTVRAVFVIVHAVTNSNDNGPGSLSEALTLAEDGDYVSIQQGLTISLTATLPPITKSITIEGNGATLTQNGMAESNTSQLLGINSSSAVVRISRLHFKGGRASDYAAAINNTGTLTLESCVFSDNRTSSIMAWGGAIYTTGNTTISSCTFYGNVAGTTRGIGGAIYTGGGTLTLTGNIFWGNTASSYPVVYGAATSKGYNISDRPIGTGSTDSGWALATGDAQSSSLFLYPADFKPFNPGAAYQAVIARPGDYPPLDFYGVSIPSSGAMAGAVQTAMAVTGFYLDYAAEGPGQVTVKTGSGNDGFYNNSVTLEAVADGNGKFLHWTVDGEEQEPQLTPNEIDITMNDHKTVRAVFINALLVTDPGNAGAGTLRQAILDAVAGDYIILPAGQTITITTSLAINKSLTIEGNGATLAWGGSTTSTSSQLLRITGSSTEVLISRLLFKGGRATNNGAAINNTGKLTLESCIFYDNKTSASGSLGGAIYNSGGSLTVSGCTFTGNGTGSGSSKGGAIYRSGGTVTLTGNIFSGNTANTSPVVFHASPGATTGGYNVSDKASGYTDNSSYSGWTFNTGLGEKRLTDVTFPDAGTGDFTPVSASSGLPVILSLPVGFPATYFDGSSRGSDSTPGAMPASP